MQVTRFVRLLTQCFIMIQLVLFLTLLLSAFTSGNDLFVKIPNLPLNFYKYWLRNNIKAHNAFKLICNQYGNSSNINSKDISQNQFVKDLYSKFNVHFEQNVSQDYKSQILLEICPIIEEVALACWGYEKNCHNVYLMPDCDEKVTNSRIDLYTRRANWFTKTDYGYIAQQRNECNLYCYPDRKSKKPSSLECTRAFKACRGTNLFLKFDESISSSSKSLIKPMSVMGKNCDLQKARIREEKQKSALFSTWYSELEDYKLLQPGNEKLGSCDIHFDIPIIFIKLDPSRNQHRSVCSLLSLYITMHMYNKVTKSNQLVLWQNTDKDTSNDFDKLIGVFTENQVKTLQDFKAEQQICIDEFYFSFPTQTEDQLCFINDNLKDYSCSKTGLFDSFNKYLIHSLNIKRSEEIGNLKVTIITAETKDKQIDFLKLKDLLEAKRFEVNLEKFSYFDVNHIEKAYNSDILIGLTSEKLVHTLFLPDWASLIELKLDQKEIYQNIALQRGVGYESIAITKDQELESIVKLVELTGSQVNLRKQVHIKNNGNNTPVVESNKVDKSNLSAETEYSKNKNNDKDDNKSSIKDEL